MLVGKAAIREIFMNAITFQDSQIKAFAEAIQKAPLGMYRSSTQDYTLIPASIKPLIMPDLLWKTLQTEARLILSAIEKLGRWLEAPEQQGLADVLFSDLSPLEQRAARGLTPPHGGLVTARLDLFFDGDALRVIEANTTIPAMQAYGDMIRAAYLGARGHAAIDPQKTNSYDLLLSLLQHYEKCGGTLDKPRIGIVARPGDSQLAELLWFQREWQSLGYETCLFHPEDISLKGDQIWAHSTPMDLVYRHIFAHRLPEDSALAMACLQPQRYRLFNPMSAHLEAKGVLAELSRIVARPDWSAAIGLSEEERAANLHRLAWSRLLQEGPSLSPDGENLKDLTCWAKDQQKDLVVKSSLGYGGKGVFLGEDFHSPATQERVQQLLQMARPIAWHEFIDFCQQQRRGSWILQKKLPGRQIKNEFLLEGQIKKQETFIDCSIFTNSGVPHKPGGGACRFSSDTIVNLGQGGGLAPLLLESEWQSLLS